MTKYYYSVDEQGSTDLITDTDGNIKNEYWYDAFGNVLESREEVHNKITYTGQQFDNTTQQYYLRARFYNPVIGRFTQEDVYRSDGLNLYAYCGNNPVVYWDPGGYSTQRELVKNVPNMTYEQRIEALNKQYTEFINNKIKNKKYTISQDGLEKHELETDTYNDMFTESGDKLTPHHMPAANSLDKCSDGIAYKDGVCLNVREDTHRLKFTYGMSEKNRPYDTALYNSLNYKERLEFDYNNIRKAYELQRPNVSKENIEDALRVNKEKAMNASNTAITKNGKCK